MPSNLKIDCSRMKYSAIETLAKYLRQHFSSVQIAGSDFIFVSGKIDNAEAIPLQKILSWFDIQILT